MSPESKLLLDEMNRLFAEQKDRIDARFTESERKMDARFIDSDTRLEKRFREVDESITKRFTEFDDAITKRLFDYDLNWERRITDSELRQSTLLTELDQRQDRRLAAIEQSTGSLESWRQESEGEVDDLKLKMSKLTIYWDRSVLDQASGSSGLISQGPVAPTAARSSADITVARPNGHGVETTTRADGIGGPPSPIHSPANGMQSVPHPSNSAGVVHEIQSHTVIPDETQHHPNRLPKFNFPTYDGETTKLWISQAEDYFDMYGVPPRLWVKEEVAAPAPKLEFHKNDSGSSYRGNLKTAMLLPRPPAQAKAAVPVQPATPQAATPEDKLSTLRSFRRVQGLCHRCAEKWFRGHKCAPTIQLKAMQEVWDLFQLEELPESPEEPIEQLNLAISHDARMGSQGPRTIQFQGSVHGLSVVVLIDSGSSASFLAESVANRLPQLPRTALTASVKIANGQILRCSSVIVDCQFALGDYQFQHDLRILQLDSYDLILGMDWLSRYSPMQIHWESKWLSIPYHGDQIVLQGLTAPLPNELVFQLFAIDTSADSSEIPAIPLEISEILSQFPSVFKIPDSLPPPRSCDHAIPLKHVLFVWTEEHQQAFQSLKHPLCSAPVLGIPNFSKPFALETDACQNGVGAVLLQDGHPLAYVSKPLGIKTQGLST
ncbi:unnamed protein product [Miscanthus lutarioriparius]|uniref:Reverse transcriptase/retrotransposon-derived protein RNase H-like domain-containing protein n=1 Tax=Miscanthus lutarioriparius TaxID=422564 RepID=A0A811P1M0_9POAL|nr:unnamed protein product [Miscanthus lutarioriparius]